MWVHRSLEEEKQLRLEVRKEGFLEEEVKEVEVEGLAQWRNG